MYLSYSAFMCVYLRLLILISVKVLNYLLPANVMEITQTYVVFFQKAVYINIYQPLHIIILPEFVQLVFC